ncbi:disease resistance protein L6-like [Rhodamnia argentea]|uniref:Disease resistance protein L6-like n=1 Tax=Rhodamnia argentea TaxID=178133 RepID=A0ABM3HJ53_9MYRT|nr:disease resistance protein L6-like [Rhodamnia argentea]
MAVPGEHRPLDGFLPHGLTSNTPFPSLKLSVLIGILSLSALSIALLICLCIRLRRTSKKRNMLAKETDSRASSGPSYEVFLSFRGVDTRHEFTDFLYDGMHNAGILVFRDSESLHVGKRIADELLQAIENSKIYIPVFSKNYAWSHWCLRELAHMVECTSKSNGNKEILPIFLDVEPDDVKLKTNLYSKALLKHQKKFCTEVESWKKALIEVDKVKGWNWKRDEGQADLRNSVIETVLDKLNAGNKKIVSENLVGVYDRVKALIKMLDVGSDNVQFLIIHRMGGIGKTTLAKCVFNQLSSDFKDRNFLSNIRESSQRHGMVYLQKQLLSEFLDSRSFVERIHDVNEGINMIKRVLGSKKVLIVLDDVDGKEQLKSLAEKGDWFCMGSRIIITTRDQSILRIEGEASSEGPVEKSSKVTSYEVHEMEFDDALKLFSKHAFRRDSPRDQFFSLSNEIVSTLGRLPLALEVTGSSLNNESEEFWKATLKKLKEAPPKEVQSTLMISYDKLEDKQKQVFLDIACFFIDDYKTCPFYMWDACGYHPHVTIKVLCLMSLIKIKDDDTFWMHDQVRDLGREIIRQENCEDPSKRSRVWNPKETRSILKGKEGSTKIKALSLGRRKGILTVTGDELANLQKLRFFQGGCVSLAGDVNRLFPSLTWLSCRDFSLEFEAKNFHPTNLAVLDLSWSNISEERIDWIRVASKLKVLDLGYCHRLTRTPDLSTLVSLEKLILRSCWNIKELPNSIGKLQSLIELDLSGTSISHLPDSIGNPKQLTILGIGNSQGITKLPGAIAQLDKLVVLDAGRCQNLTGEIPAEIERLSCLRILDLSWTKISRLPTTVNRLSNLQELKLARSDIKQLPELPPSLTCPTWEAAIYLESFSSLPTSIGTLSQLKALALASPNVRLLPQLPSSLRELKLVNLAIVQPLDFSNLVKLSTLEFYSCSILEFSGRFGPELEKLYLGKCSFGRLDALFQLEMRRLPSLTLDMCEFLPEILDLSHMKNLQEVFLFGRKLQVAIRGLEELGSLSSLMVVNCSSIEWMSDLSKLRKLEKLQVKICPKLRSLEGVNHLESLKRMWIHDCGLLECLADTSNMDLGCCHVVHCDLLPDRHCCEHGSNCRYLSLNGVSLKFALQIMHDAEVINLMMCNANDRHAVRRNRPNPWYSKEGGAVKTEMSKVEANVVGVPKPGKNKGKVIVLEEVKVRFGRDASLSK